MSLRARQFEPMTIAAFDAFTDSQPDDVHFELVAGRVVMMSNPTQRHEQIAANIGAPLKLAMDQRRCRTYQGGMRVQLGDNTDETDKVKPDVVVRCGRTTRTADVKNYITDQLVVVEVLSPSTMDVDRGPKLDFYKIIPTLRHIAIVYQDQMRIEHYYRTDTGWQHTVLTRPEDTLYFEAVSFKITLEQVYFDIDFSDAIQSTSPHK
jgi:Uma2 family endonuclease